MAMPDFRPLIFKGPFDERNHVDGAGRKIALKTETYLQGLGLQSVDRFYVGRTVFELAKNHWQYNRPGYEKQSSIIVLPASEWRVEIRSAGVITTRYFREYEARVNYTKSRDSEELDAMKARILNYGERPAEIGPCTLSQGNSLGTIEMAANARNPLVLELGKAIARGLFEFAFVCPYQLSEPMRPHADLARNSAAGLNPQ